MRRFVLSLLIFPIISLFAQPLKVKDALKKTDVIVFQAGGKAVERTVTEQLNQSLAPQAQATTMDTGMSLTGKHILHVAIITNSAAKKLLGKNVNLPEDKDWMFFQINSTGDGYLLTSKMHLLYALFCLVRDDWAEQDVTSFAGGRVETSTFVWLEGGDGIFPGHGRPPRHYDVEKSIEEIARAGISHITVNGIAGMFPFEEGPPDEIYYRFYYGSPDLDQFAETELDKGIYPPEYLQSNMNFLKKNAKLALKYGITPGLYICTPRSVPEALLQRYPYLRGARIDHTFRATRPRYTLTLAHPVVRWHYAELMKKIMREVPELAYVGVRTNDAGSGFEYNVMTYPGRNGGPYLIREWKSNEEIAKKAANNALRYFQVLRDAASEINPAFRVIIPLGNFPSEAPFILQNMNNRIDLSVSLSDTVDQALWEKEKALLQKGSYLFSGVGLTSAYIQGVPFPWLAHERLTNIIKAGFPRITAGVHSPCTVPYDINREVFKTHNLSKKTGIDQIIKHTANNWVGTADAPNLIEAWRLCEQTVRIFPSVRLYEAYGFYTLRPWIRPFVPDIGKIPSQQRAYYEDYLNAVFHNPTLVDFAADALWNLVPTAEAEKILEQCNAKVWNPLNEAIAILDKSITNAKAGSQTLAVLSDQRDRMVGLRCYYRTLRNLAAWVAGVHGYMEAKDEPGKQARLKIVRDMMVDEMSNTRDLLKLWETSKVDFMPISEMGETMYDYSYNFGEHLQKKLKLMEEHKNDTPYIDPNFMWQMPVGFPVDKNEYLKY